VRQINDGYEQGTNVINSQFVMCRVEHLMASLPSNFHMCKTTLGHRKTNHKTMVSKELGKPIIKD